MKSLNEDLKTGQFKQIYLLYGEEAYLKKLYKNRFVKAMVPEGDTMNYRYFEGKNTNPKEIIDLAETLPFFAERRLIVLENTGFLKNATPELAEYLKNMPETTYMIFVESELDKRGKLYKVIKEKGHIVELKRQDEKTLIRWILGMAKKEKLQMSEAAVRYLLAKTGNDMENLGQELEKLFCYCMNHTEITAADIDEICTTQIGNHIFDMVDAVAAKEQKKALDYYYDLLTLKEPPMRILYLLTRQFRILMEVKEMDRTGIPPKIAAKVGIMPFLVGKYRAQAKAFTRKELRGIVEAGVQTEEDVKTGKMGDILSVELFLVQYSSKREK
jgi:DNA polymerase-3 subunit delta